MNEPLAPSAGTTVPKRASLRRSLTSSLPPLGSAAAAAAIAAASLNAPQGIAPAVSYKNEAISSTSRSVSIDRSQVSEKRRQRRLSQEMKAQALAQQQAHQAMLAPLPLAPFNMGSSTISELDSGDLEKSQEQKTSLFDSRPPTTSGLRIPTPLPDLRPRPGSASGTVVQGHIDLHLPSHISGSQSARQSTQPPSSLAAITQDTNKRVAKFLMHYEGHRREDSTTAMPGNKNGSTTSPSKSHRLILANMSHLTPQQLEEEREISRLLNNWHPVKSQKTFSSLSNKIRHIISERVSLFEGHWQGKTLVEDAGFVSEELEKKKSAFFKILVPSNVTICKVDLDVIEGRVEMFISVGEPHHHVSGGGGGGGGGGGKEKAPHSGHAWNLRATAGHHSLTVHASDPNWRQGEYFWVSLYALQTSSVQIKVSLGGKGKSVQQQVASPAAGGGGAASGQPGQDDGPASSGTRLTARQANATKHAPSTRNIRKTLEARVRALADNPKALKAFQAKVHGMRKAGIAGMTQGSNLPAHLSDRQLNELNRTQAEAEAALTGGDQSQQPQRPDRSPSSSPRGSERRLDQSNPSSPRQRRPKQEPKFRPQPLTPWSLNHIAHIGAIEGVSKAFYDTAKELRPPVLNDRDFIVMLGDQLATTQPGSPTLQPNTGNRGKSSQNTRPESSQAPSPAQTPYGNSQGFASQFPSPAQSPTSGSGQSFANQLPPTLERKISLNTTLTVFLTRVLKRMKSRSQQLSQLGQQGDESAMEQSYFLSRCLSIYEAHLTELEHCLLAHTTGDATQPHLARFLEPSLPPKNFLLVNAFDATDNRTYLPVQREKRRKEWQEIHAIKSWNADIRREEHLEAKRTQTLEMIQRKERERADALAERAAIAEKLALEQLQRAWLRHLAATLRHKWLKNARLHLHPMRVEAFRKNHAARKIQLFIRMTLAIKRKTRASLHFQAFRSMMLLCATNYNAVKRDRAANCIKLFIEQKKGVDSVSRLVKNFRRRVGICQRHFRTWIACHKSKIILWRLQYDRRVAKMHNAVLSQDITSRERLLQELFQTMKKEAMSQQDAYEAELALYKERLEQEVPKNLVIFDDVLDLLAVDLWRKNIPQPIKFGLERRGCSEVNDMTLSTGRFTVLDTVRP